MPAAATLLAVALCWAALLRGGMAGVAAWYVLQLPVPLLGLALAAAVLVHALRRRRFSPALAVTLAISLAALLPVTWLFGVVPLAYPAALDSTVPSATVRLPAEVPLRVAWGGDDVRVNRHARVPDQRWAYDFFVAPYLSGSRRLEDYGCYGVAVVAPASGRVAGAHDGEPDMRPGRESRNYAAPLGNHVVLRLAPGTYLVIAHLQPGSVTVRRGQRIEEGRVVGRCGNSGNTSEPHIHIHHQRQDPAAYPVNFAEGLPLYFRDHDGPRMPEGGIDMRDGRPIATGRVVRHRGKPASPRRSSPLRP